MTNKYAEHFDQSSRQTCAIESNTKTSSFTLPLLSSTWYFCSNFLRSSVATVSSRIVSMSMSSTPLSPLTLYCQSDFTTADALICNDSDDDTTPYKNWGKQLDVRKTSNHLKRFWASMATSSTFLLPVTSGCVCTRWHRPGGSGDQVQWGFPFSHLRWPTCFRNLKFCKSLTLSTHPQSNSTKVSLTMAILIYILSVHYISMMKTVVEKLQDFCEAWASACERWRHLADVRGNRWHGARLATGRRPIQRERRGYYLQSLTSTQRTRRWGRGGRFKRKTCGWRKVVRSGKLSGIYVWRQLRRRRRGGKVDRW